MTNPLISVIVTCYKLEKYLPNALDSLLNQTYKNIEIIIVNDCSPSDVDSVVEPYLKYPNIVYIKNEVNKGLSTCRNIAVKNSTGQFVMSLDADDYFAPECISDMVAEIEDENTVVRVKTAVTDENRKVIDWYEYPNLPWTPEVMYMEDIVNVTTMISRKIFDLAGGYDEFMLGYEDWDLWIRISKLETHLKTVDKFYFYYMIRSDSMIRTMNHDRWFQYIKNKYPELQTPREAQIVHLYKTILGRYPDQSGLLHYYYSNLPIDTIKSILKNSDEYKAIHG